MSEREQSRKGTAPGESEAASREERLRLLYAAVYPPTFPAVKPSEGLRRRVAEVTEPRNARSIQRHAGWLLTFRWAPAVGVLAAAALLAVVGLMLVRSGHDRMLRQPASRLVDGSPPDRLSPGPAPQRPRNDPERRIVTRHSLTPTWGGDSPPFLPAASHDSRSGFRGQRSPMPGLPSESQAVDDLVYVNRDPKEAIHQWLKVPRDDWEKIEARVRHDVQVRDDFVQIPFIRLVSTSERQIAQAVESYKREAAIVDPRLSHEVNCAFKATALSDLCDHLRADTGIQLSAGSSVTDEKVTLFCEKMPLREVMRQLSRPFGYTWLRSKREGGEYHYELVQDLRSQLLEEEMRNRDRNAALLALDREIQQYRPYLDLSPDKALEKAKTASPTEKKLLERLSGLEWGVAQLYFRLSPEQINSLRAGQELEFHAEPRSGEPQLPGEMAVDVLSSLRHRRVLVSGDTISWGYPAQLPTGIPPAQVEGAHPLVHVRIVQSELGQYTLEGFSGLTLEHPECVLLTRDDARVLGPLATGISPSAQQPNNAAANSRLSHDPTLQRRVSAQPKDLSPGPSPERGGESRIRERVGEAKVTSADVLEAVHRATGMPIVADYYTRLYPASTVSCADQRLYDALNHLADAMRLRWHKEGGALAESPPASRATGDAGSRSWLQFRSASYFQDRLKEVPNRLLNRWAAARRQRGHLTLEELLEIAALTDAQLDATGMAEGAKALFGLEEWDLARHPSLRPHWRFLAELTPEQRQEAAAASGLSFTRLTLPQQQEFLRLGLGTTGDAPPIGLQELATATLKIDYSVPGWFQWTASGTPDSSLPGSIQRPTVRERTRAAALAAARKRDPGVTEADVVPTSLDGVVIYAVGTRDTHHAVRVISSHTQSFSID
jgi:hypothetical protein